MIKLDIGCGVNKRQPQPGEDQTPWIGVDQFSFGGKVDVLLRVGAKNIVPLDDNGDPIASPFRHWPWEDNSVDEIHSSHFIEHLDRFERIHFFNETYRVLKPDARMILIAPHSFSERAYGDPTHQWPPVTGFMCYYLSKQGRLQMNPGTDIDNWPLGYSCNFEAAWGYSLHGALQTKAQEVREYAQTFYKEAIQDIQIQCIKRVMPAAQPAAQPPG